MDLKESNVSVESDLGQFNGTVLELVLFLRERAVSDLSLILEGELTSTSESYISAEGDDDIGDELDLNEYYKEEYNNDLEEEGYAVDESEINLEPVKPAETIDTSVSTKISKYGNVISFYDDIIALDGVVTTISNPAVVYINKFKELSGVFQDYSYFEIFTPTA